jgi:hypothetical protein
VKRDNFGSETKPKYAVLIMLWSEAKNLKQKEAKEFIISHAHAKQVSF